MLTTALLLATGCEFLDPTNVENPRTTTEDLARAQNPTEALLPGLRAQFARSISASSVLFEVVSDNYSIHGTALNSELDNVEFINANLVNTTSATGGGVYWNTQELRALADFVLDDIAPGDDTKTPELVAEAHYYRGMAYLIQGENFTHVPVESDGAPLPADQLLGRAVADFTAAISQQGSGEWANRSRAALARAHRLLGNATEAAQFAQDALAAGAEFLYLREFDEQTIVNGANQFLVVRAIKEMQPLPRLDFLDPKYTTRSSGIPVAKAEEMHLILAEIALLNDVATARGHLVDALEVALARPTVSFTDNDERRNADLSFRPRSSDMLVRADANSPFRSGLVLDRPGESIQVPVISGTSLDPDSVAALTDEDEIWHAFHLARQEILFLEGRRMSDLGIRMPMMQREIDANANISATDPGTVVVVPAHIPATNGMDRFNPASPYDDDGNVLETEITILHDMNRVLTTQRVNAFN